MSSRRNFLDSDKSIMERNLRFVKNGLEDNLNQYFNGSDSRGINTNHASAPSRAFKDIQPKPGGSHSSDQGQRKAFLMKLGFVRHEAYELSKSIEFDVNCLEQKLPELFGRGLSEEEVRDRILYDIRNQNKRIENISLQKRDISEVETPPPPPFPKFYEEPDNLNVNRHAYKGGETRSRSPSRQHSFSRNERVGDRFQPEKRSISLSTRQNEEYFSPQVNMLNDTKRKLNRSTDYSPTMTNRGEPCNRTFERQLPNRMLNPMPETRDDKDDFPRNSLKDEIDRRPRSQFLENDNRRGGDKRKFDRHIINDMYVAEKGRNVSPPHKVGREEYFPRRRSRSPNRVLATNVHTRRRNAARDPIRQRSISPPRKANREEYFRSAGLSSKNEEFSLDHTKRRNVTGEPFHQRLNSSPRKAERKEYFETAKTRSPNRMSSLKGEGFSLDYDYSLDEPKRHDFRSRSRSYSPSQINCRPIRRSRSPNKSFSHGHFKDGIGIHPSSEENYLGRRPNYSSESPSQSRGMGHYDDIGNRTSELSRSNNRRNFDCEISISRSPNRHLHRNNDRNNQDIKDRSRQDSNSYNIAPEASSSSLRLPGTNTSRPNNAIFESSYRNIPPLLAPDVFPRNLTKESNQVSKNRNIPSLLSVKIFSDQITDFQQSLALKNYEKPRQNPPQKKEFTAEPFIIESGLARPPPGHLKAKPRDYWSKWWPRYKYIESSIQKINPNHREVKSEIYFTLKPNSGLYTKRCQILLFKGTKEIMKTVGIDETNYYKRPILKVFLYKKHLEDPNFQNSLTPDQLNRIAPALRQFRKKPTMAYLHQALIARWHSAVEEMKQINFEKPILSNGPLILCNQRVFHYLVMESIQELKKMCQQDWPGFNEFYKNIKAERIDIYSIGVPKFDD